MITFWRHVMPYSLVKEYRHFGRFTWPCVLMLFNKNPEFISHLSVHAICPAHLITLPLLIMIADQCKLWIWVLSNVFLLPLPYVQISPPSPFHLNFNVSDQFYLVIKQPVSHFLSSNILVSLVHVMSLKYYFRVQVDKRMLYITSLPILC
jgi:hypothetical protein